MALRKIAQIGHPILRGVSQPVSAEDILSPAIQSLIDDLIETMRDAQGAGLAAPQIYAPWRVCVLEVGDNRRYPGRPKIPLTVLINPVLTPLVEARFDNFEGCLSVPGLRGRVRRYAHLRVEALDRQGKKVDFVAKGITAGTYQHEVDHLDGLLFLDKVTDHHSLCTWEHFTRYYEDAFKREMDAIVAQWGE